MSVVTISRQIGSHGFVIGRQVADALGYHFIWRNVINQAARQSGAPAAALAMIDELQLLGICPSPDECRRYLEVMTQTVQEIARQGNAVILGRAGQCILAGFPDCLHVRITAPEQLRAQRVAEQQGIPLTAALAQVKASDRGRKAYLRRFYQARWDDPAHYDLVINTRHLQVSDAVAVICSAVRTRQAGAAASPHPEESRS